MLKTVLTAVVAAIALSPVAHADESGFIEAIHSLNHYTATDQEILNVGHQVCAALDRGEHGQSVVREAFPDNDEFADYYAVRFMEYAQYQLCEES
ncbi:hypothetical protein PBI_GAIA_166 [Mycobacterium phage Gaia]|uniref:DUF732 domain-containing protein n=1 Tax=Mycobacterium phage Gaia TaxID=1486472 RepID=A0A068F203_9CAUD|nr:hypothetical protein VC46_gp070 [Mycobacterium phage Gaia]AID58982.1 hypothetical protein PBI_GAIA_166 [Mycobacterium phage Gaia]AYR00091.1 hypothetical protein PBI_NEBKISS_162 [Mycobacterium phage Nebkiss]